MKTKILIVLLAVNISVYAQVEKGDMSLSINGSYSKTGDENSFGLINAKFGRFFTQNIEVGVKPQLQFGKGYSGTGLGAYGTYNFLTSAGKLLPYAGLEISTLSQSYDEGDDISQTDLGLYAGTKLFFSEAVFVDFGLNVSTNLSTSVESYDPGTLIMFNIGLGFILGKLK